MRRGLYFLASGSVIYSAYALGIRSRRGLSGILGYALLLLAKGLRNTTLARVGYTFLLGTPSYEAWYDIFAVLGLVLALLGHPEALTPTMALYYASGMPHVMDRERIFAIRGFVALVFALGVENPLTKIS